MILQEKFLKQGNWLFKYRGILPLIIVLAGFLVYSLEIYNKNYYFLFKVESFDLYLYFSVFISLIGFFIRVYTVGYTPHNTSGRNTKGQVADTLNSTGIYSIVRHPLYLGNFFMWLGPIIFVGDFWFAISICLFYWVYYERIMYAEESFLINKFGDQYLQWASRTPAFVPSFKLFTKSNLTFNWGKVLRKEKNGILAVFLIFSAYDFIANFMLEKHNYNFYILLVCLILLVIYMIMKIIKYRASYLNARSR
jgi:protein-S-isoprenylcysteine O-methyltransferase Ste14